MKRIISLVAIVGMLAVGVQAFGFGMPSLGGGDKKESGAKVDVDGLTGREVSLKLKVNAATISLAKGLAEIQRACGKAAEAEKLEGAIANAQANPKDIESTKKLVVDANNACEAINKYNLDATMNKDVARKSMGKSLLNLGAATLVDTSSVNDAKGLITDISAGLKSVQASPMTYGPSAVTNLTSALNTANLSLRRFPHK